MWKNKINQEERAKDKKWMCKNKISNNCWGNKQNEMSIFVGRELK